MRDPQTARDAVVFELRCRGIRLHDVAIDAVLAYIAGTSCDRDAAGPTPAAAVLALAAKLDEAATLREAAP